MQAFSSYLYIFLPLTKVAKCSIVREFVYYSFIDRKIVH